MGPIALITDFGTADGYAGEVKGELLSRLPGASVVDVTHDISPGDVEAAAWVLARVWTRYPPETVHLVVVDPGVGSARRAVAVRAAERWFVGPDNGLLTRVSVRHPPEEARALDPGRVGTGPLSSTFHGRDLFAPAASLLAAGRPGAAVGRELDPAGLVRLVLPEPERRGETAHGRICHVDRFGNLVTDIPSGWIPPDPAVEVAERTLRGLARSYAARGSAAGPVFALVGSAGTLEIAVEGGSAAERLGARRGDPVLVRPA